jgi:hypothetical protein
VAVLGTQPRPVVRARTRLHCDRARRQRRHQLQQFGARNARALQFNFAKLIDAVHGKDVLGEIDSNAQNSHGLLLPMKLMNFALSSWHLPANRRNLSVQLYRIGEFSFIR